MTEPEMLKEQMRSAMAEAFQPEAEEFVIDNDDKLAWYLEKLRLEQERITAAKARHHTRLKAIQAVMQEETMRLEAELEQEIKPSQLKMVGLQARFHAQVVLFIKEKLAKSRGKSLKMHGFQLGFRKQPDKFKAEDTQKLLDWCHANDPEKFIRFSESPDMSEIKAHFQETGERPDGVLIADGEDEFYVDLGGQKLEVPTDVTE